MNFKNITFFQQTKNNRFLFKIKSRKGHRGPVELILVGRIYYEDTELLIHALEKFEKFPNRKHMLDLSQVEFLSLSAGNEIIALKGRMKQKGGVLGITNISAPAEKTFRALCEKDSVIDMIKTGCAQSVSHCYSYQQDLIA